jgi:hypothetical protein
MTERPLPTEGKVGDEGETGESYMNPVESYMNHVESYMNPVESYMNPVESSIILYEPS